MITQKLHPITMKFLEFAASHPTFKVRQDAGELDLAIELPRPDGTYDRRARIHSAPEINRLERVGTLHPDEIVNSTSSSNGQLHDPIIQISGLNLGLSKKQMEPLIEELSQIIRPHMKDEPLERAFNPSASGEQVLVDTPQINFSVIPLNNNGKRKSKGAIILTVRTGKPDPQQPYESDGWGTPDPTQFF